MRKRKLFKSITTGRIENDDEYWDIINVHERIRRLMLYVFAVFSLVYFLLACAYIGPSGIQILLKRIICGTIMLFLFVEAILFFVDLHIIDIYEKYEEKEDNQQLAGADERR